MRKLVVMRKLEEMMRRREVEIDMKKFGMRKLGVMRKLEKMMRRREVKMN